MFEYFIIILSFPDNTPVLKHVRLGFHPCTPVMYKDSTFNIYNYDIRLKYCNPFRCTDLKKGCAQRLECTYRAKRVR